jgi:hypothetical protein
MVTEARIVEMDDAAREGRVCVVNCTPRLVTTAHQARQLGKDVLMWLWGKSVPSKGCCLTAWLSQKNTLKNT